MFYAQNLFKAYRDKFEVKLKVYFKIVNGINVIDQANLNHPLKPRIRHLSAVVTCKSMPMINPITFKRAPPYAAVVQAEHINCEFLQLTESQVKTFQLQCTLQ